MSIGYRSAIRAACAVAVLLVAFAWPAGRPSEAARRAPAATLACTARTVTLYDGRLGGTPDTQGMDYQALALSATQSFSNGLTILDTMQRQGDSAGYFGKSTLIPVLNRTSGYTLTFDVQVVSEAHANNDRAGLSVIALSSDTKGIELGFWQDQVWAQNDGSAEPPAGTLFTHGESGLFSATTGLVSYTLALRGDTYALAANGTLILSGPLRDYTAFNGFPDVYETPNLIFLGDDTSSARAKIKLATLAVSIPQCSHLQYLPLVMVAN